MKNPIDIYSTKDYKKVEAVVQLMVDGKVTSYRVATETDISMESQSISKNLFFMVFSFSKKESTRKAVRIG